MRRKDALSVSLFELLSQHVLDNCIEAWTDAVSKMGPHEAHQRMEAAEAMTEEWLVTAITNSAHYAQLMAARSYLAALQAKELVGGLAAYYAALAEQDLQ